MERACSAFREKQFCITPHTKPNGRCIRNVNLNKIRKVLEENISYFYNPVTGNPYVNKSQDLEEQIWPQLKLKTEIKQNIINEAQTAREYFVYVCM